MNYYPSCRNASLYYQVAETFAEARFSPSLLGLDRIG